MTITEAKATIYANVVYACEKAGLAPQTTRLVQDACDTIIAIADACETIVALADRKTENSSEKPNNSKVSEKLTGSTISKMEQVDELQTEDDRKHCVFCKWVYEPNVCGRCRNMNLFADAIEDEPQTENLFTDKDGDVWAWRGDAWYCISGMKTGCAWK